MPNNNGEIEKRLWAAADELRANSKLKSSEYSSPVLGLIFLRYADHKFAHVERDLVAKKSSRRTVGKADYHARGVLYLPDKARFEFLLNLPEGADVGKAINSAMRLIEGENEELRGVLPKNYQTLENKILATLLKNFGSISMDLEGDVFGRIYEYFLGEFAKAEGSRGGEFFTATSIVKLIVEILEPFHGRIFDPACGSGGMFVQSAHFIERHRKNPSNELSIYGQEKVAETVRLCKMNLAVHGLSGDIREGNTYYEDIHESVGKFDFVMANPPFNVDKVDKERLKDDSRFPFGMPRADNANYLWIQVFYSALKETGRAGFVMANSASDARGTELEIRRKLIEDCGIDAVISVGTNFFYTVTLPVTLWFFDRGKTRAKRSDHVLFIDASDIYRQIDRAHRDWSPQQIEFLANIVRMWRGEDLDFTSGSDELILARFPDKTYVDVPGLSASVDLASIKKQGFSLSPGRYVGSASETIGHDFEVRLAELDDEYRTLSDEARMLDKKVRSMFQKVVPRG